MKAVVFAAGMGTRLKPFTDRHPKALVEIGGEAMLGHVLLKIKDAGISEVIVNVHHFASQIVDYLKARNNFGMTVHISDESALLLDTGGALALVHRRGLFGNNCDSVLVHNADIMTDFSLRNFIRAFAAETDAEAMLLVDSARQSTRKLLFNRDSMCMCGWQNENTGQIRPEGLEPRKAERCMKAAFGGVHIISSETLADVADYAACMARKDSGADTLDGVVPFSITDYYIGMCRKKIFCAYQPAEAYRWFDVGRPESLEKAREAFVKSRN